MSRAPPSNAARDVIEHDTYHFRSTFVVDPSMCGDRNNGAAQPKQCKWVEKDVKLRNAVAVFVAARSLVAFVHRRHLLLTACTPYACQVLENMLSFPGRSQLAGFETSKGERMIAWVETTQGRDNIYVAKSTSTGVFSAAYPVTEFTVDDGSAITLYGFFSEDVIHFDRRATSDANPTHYSIPHKGGFYAASTSPKTNVDFITSLPVSAVANGNAYWTTIVPSIGAPAGNLGSRKYDAAALMRAPLTSSGRALVSPAADPIVVLSTKHGSIDEYMFSPDSRVVAVVNNRGDHGFIGLFSLENGTVIHWLAPTHNMDVAPT